MFDPAPVIAAYREGSQRLWMNVYHDVILHARTRGYMPHNGNPETYSKLEPQAGNSSMIFWLEHGVETGFYFQVECAAAGLYWFQSRQASYRGTVRVACVSLDVFLDEQDKRLKRWLRAGRPNNLNQWNRPLIRVPLWV